MKAKKILIVEDEELISLALKFELEERGFEICDRIAYGDMVLEAVKKWDPDLVLLDINLKGNISGIEACNVLHENGLNPKIIYMTAYSDKEMINAASETNPLAFLEKPINTEELTSVLSR